MTLRHWAVWAALLSWLTPATAADPPAKFTDAEISRLIVGTWAAEGGAPGAKAEGLTRYKKDGAFSADGSVQLGELSVMVRVEGTWKVSGGAVHITLTKSSHPGIAPVGAELKNVVTVMGEKEYRYKRGSGPERVRYRVPE
jgi:hypothetical protein